MSPSCTIRYADRSRPAGRGDGSPSTRRSTVIPAAPTSWSSRSRSASPGCGISSAVSPSSRIALSRRRISVSAVRPASSTLRSASRSADALSGIRCRTAPTCRTITLTACATTSCSSRAIRARSSATATRAAASRSRSARAARSSAASVRSVRSRSAHPTSQPMANITGTEIRSSVEELGPLRTTVREPATTITRPTRESIALRWAPSSTAAPMPAIRMPAPLTISWPSRKESPAHTSQVVAGCREGEPPAGQQDQHRRGDPDEVEHEHGAARVLEVVTRDGRHRGHERGDDDQEVETMPGEEQPCPAHVVTVRRAAHRAASTKRRTSRVVVRYPWESGLPTTRRRRGDA